MLRISDAKSVTLFVPNGDQNISKETDDLPNQLKRINDDEKAKRYEEKVTRYNKQRMTIRIYSETNELPLRVILSSPNENFLLQTTKRQDAHYAFTLEKLATIDGYANEKPLFAISFFSLTNGLAHYEACIRGSDLNECYRALKSANQLTSRMLWMALRACNISSIVRNCDKVHRPKDMRDLIEYTYADIKDVATMIRILKEAKRGELIADPQSADLPLIPGEVRYPVEEPVNVNENCCDRYFGWCGAIL